MKKRRRNVPLVWLKDFPDDKEKQDFEEILRNNTRLFTVLRRIIDDFEEQMDLEESTTNDYSDSSWPYKQAFRNGQRTALRRIKLLTDFIEG
jgi:hypothetical protein